MVIVIISNGKPPSPIIPSTEIAAKLLGKIAIKAILKERNSRINITKIARNTAPNVIICELNKLCSMLLYNTNKPVKRTFLLSKVSSCSICALMRSTSSLRFNPGYKSFTRRVIRACSSSATKYGDNKTCLTSCGKDFSINANSKSFKPPLISTPTR